MLLHWIPASEYLGTICPIFRVTNPTQYWNWLTNQNDLTKHPVFDGSDTSMSGDGSFVQHNGSVGGAGAIFLPSGQGGGCITSGPFKKYVCSEFWGCLLDH